MCKDQSSNTHEDNEEPLEEKKAKDEPLEEKRAALLTEESEEVALPLQEEVDDPVETKAESSSSTSSSGSDSDTEEEESTSDSQDSSTLPSPSSSLRIGEEVLARFSDDGWYYRGTVKHAAPHPKKYYIRDGVGHIEIIRRAHILSDRHDADNIISVGDHVIALHPSFEYAYAPATVIEVAEIDGALSLSFYDELEFVVPREEAYLISASQFNDICEYIHKCEQDLIGQAVVARDDKTGVFNLCSVSKKLSGARNYLIQWSNGNLEVQNYAYLFGSHTKRHEAKPDDHVLAIPYSGSDTVTYLPGKVKSIDKDGLLSIRFCDKTKVSRVDPMHTFWTSKEYYNSVVAYWKRKQLGDEK